MAVTPDGRIFAPIFVGQTTDDPAAVAAMAADPNTKFHPEYIMSHGGGWRDPFTDERIGGVQDRFGVTSNWSADPAHQFEGFNEAGEPVNPDGSPRNPMVVNQNITRTIGDTSGFLDEATRIQQANIASHRARTPLLGLEDMGIDTSGFTAQEQLAWTNLYNQGNENLVTTSSTLGDRARGGRLGMNPWEVLAQVIEIALEDFGQSALTAPITEADVDGWSERIAAKGTEYLQFKEARSIRSDILEWRVGDDALMTKYGVTEEQVGALMGPTGDIKHFKNTGDVITYDAADVTQVSTVLPTGEVIQPPEDVAYDEAMGFILEHYPWAEGLGLIDMIVEAVEAGTDANVLLAKIRNTPQWKATFPAIKDDQGRMRFKNENDYITRVRDYQEVLRDAGMLNEATENPLDYAALIERGIDHTELASRINEYQTLSEHSVGVRAAFRVYANMDVSNDQLYQAIIDPEASEALIEEYNRNILSADFSYEDFVARATDFSLQAALETISKMEIDGTVPTGTVARIRGLDTDQAQALVEALYLGDSADGEAFLDLDEIVQSVQYALIGGAAEEQGLVAPSLERVKEIRSAGITRAKALTAYGQYANQGDLMNSMISRTNMTSDRFTQQDFEEAQFLARPEETDLLVRGVQAEQSLAAPSGQFSVAGGRGGRLVQPGRKGPGVRY